jgi:PPOX class probable FMN-dependent enzyme
MQPLSKDKKRMKIETIDQLREVVGHPNPATEQKKSAVLTQDAIEFIGKSPLLLLATATVTGAMDVSPKGDEPGFVHIDQQNNLLIPDRRGNRLVDGHLNILQNPGVGMIFIVPNTRETLRINGTAELLVDEQLQQQMANQNHPAILITRVKVNECFFHCGKALIRSHLWQPDTWPDAARVSFGRQFVERSGADAALAEVIDANIELDYRDNL